MILKTLPLIFLSISLSALAQFLLKIGMSSEKMAMILKRDFLPSKIFGILTDLYVLSGLSLYGLGAVLWLFVLAKIDLSVAYPFVGISFILTMVLGFMFLNEQVTMMRLIGTIMIVFGVVLVGKSHV